MTFAIETRQKSIWPFSRNGAVLKAKPVPSIARTSDHPSVLHFHLTPFRGGAEEHILSIVTKAREYGCLPFLAAPNSLLKALAPELAEYGVKTFPIETKPPLTTIKLVSRLATILEDQNIDVIHCHSVISSLYAIAASRCAMIPIIETCHGREFWREGKLIKGSFWLDRQASHFIHTFIAVSNAAARFLKESKRIASNKIVVIRNGRDLKSLVPASAQERLQARAELGLNEGRAILLLGRLAIEKGHELLLEAIRLLGPSGARITLLFAGVGPLETELRKRCERDGVTHRVRFLGYQRDIKKLLAAADLVALPSVSEGLPLAAVEALAAGRPIVATRTGGIPEVVIDGQTGLLVPPGDAAALGKAIQTVLDSPALAHRLGTTGRQFVEQNFDLGVQLHQTMSLYHDVVGRATIQDDSIMPIKRSA